MTAGLSVARTPTLLQFLGLNEAARNDFQHALSAFAEALSDQPGNGVLRLEWGLSAVIEAVHTGDADLAKKGQQALVDAWSALGPTLMSQYVTALNWQIPEGSTS